MKQDYLEWYLSPEQRQKRIASAERSGKVLTWALIGIGLLMDWWAITLFWNGAVAPTFHVAPWTSGQALLVLGGFTLFIARDSSQEGLTEDRAIHAFASSAVRLIGTGFCALFF